MNITFVRLPIVDMEIDQIQEMYEDLEDSVFQYLEWKPKPALIERERGASWLYTG